MSDEIKRMRYFNGLLLEEEELNLDQKYHMDKQRIHNGCFHQWGVVSGLEIEEVPNLPQIIVKPGLAVNRVLDKDKNIMVGQEIWICENHPDNPVNLESYDVGENIYIFVSYDEANVDIDNRKGGNEEIHIWERAKISSDIKRPEDPRKDIIIACVKLTKDINNNKVVDTNSIAYDYVLVDDKKEVVRTYAITDGNTQEFGQIRIGDKERINLPYINGKIENNKDGLEIHSPFSYFTGKISSDGLTTTEATVNGTLSVNTNNKKALNVSSDGNVSIGTNASVSGNLSAAGGMTVTGDSTKIDTTTVSFKGNMLSINNYTDIEQLNGTQQDSDQNNASGISVYRGKYSNGHPKPQAILVWDENEKVWKAGTEYKTENSNSEEDSDEKLETGLYKLLYGSEWEALRDGSIADDYHKHYVIYDPKGTFESLIVDKSANVNIPNSIIVSGSIIAENGIEAARVNDKTTAKLFWNDTEGKWQITDKENKTYDVAYGDTWQKLIGKANADQFHHHSEICSRDGNVTMSSENSGDIVISNNLNVKKDLVVDGNITIKGDGYQNIKMNQIVTEKTIIVNKPEDGKKISAEGGLEVYRGEGIENAKLVWDEGSKKWKIGTGSALAELPSGNKWERLSGGAIADDLHNHRNLYSDEGSKVISVDKNKNVVIDGKVSANNGLSVAKDTQIKGALTVDGSVILNGDITVKGKQTIIDKEILNVNNSTVIVNQYKSKPNPIENEGGLEVYRGGNTPNARLVWNEMEKTWKFGIGENMQNFPCGEDWETLTENYLADGMHKHSKLYDSNGDSVLDTSQNGEVSIESNTYVNGELLVDGPLKVNGKLTVEGETEYINKKSIVTNESIISLNDNTNTIVDNGGIEISRGDKPKARFIWDEKSKVWKAGIGENLREINPVQLYNDRGDTLALSVRTTGNVDVAHDLLVGQDLTIMGNVDIRGTLTKISSSIIDVSGNLITLNRFDEGDLSEHSQDSGISIFRGSDKDSPASASLVWSEVDKCWKIGVDQFFKVEPDGSVDSHKYKVKDSLTIDEKGIFSHSNTGYDIGISFGSDRWIIGKTGFGLCITEEGKVGINSNNPSEALDVKGDANITGFMSVGNGIKVIGDSNISKDLTVAGNSFVTGNSVVEGNVSVGSLNIANNVTITKNGIEINRDDNPDDPNPKGTAKIIWDEESKCWKFGSNDKYFELSIDGKDTDSKPHQLWTKDKRSIAISTDDIGYVGIGISTPSKLLDVAGDAQITGSLDANFVSSNGVTVKGKVTANSFEVTRSNDKANPAVLCWNEQQKVWQAGTSGKLQNIVVGSHKHSELIGDKNSIVIEDSGKIKVGKNINFNTNGIIDSAGIEATGEVSCGTLKVNSMLNAVGDADIKGTLFINSNGIKTNISDTETAQIKYVAGKGWQAGTDNNLKTICYKEDFADSNNNINITKINDIVNALNISSNNIGIGGTANSSYKLNVNGDANITGKLFTGDGLFTKVGDTETAQIKYVAGEGWQAGIDNSLKTICFKEDFVNIENINNISNLITKKDNLEIGTQNTTIDAKGKLFTTGGLYTNSDGIRTKINSKDAQIKYVAGTGWQAGYDNELKTICYKEDFIDSNNITKINNVANALNVSSNNIGIGGTANSSYKLNITGDTNITGKLFTGEGLFTKVSDTKTAQIKYDAEKGWMAGSDNTLKTICFKEDFENIDSINKIATKITTDGSGNLKLGTTIVNDKLYAFKGLITSLEGIKTEISTSEVGQIKYVAGTGWQAGNNTKMSNISLEGHKHDALTFTKTEANGNKTETNVLTVTAEDKIEIGTTKKANLEVNGKITVADGIAIKSSDGKVHTLTIEYNSTDKKYQAVLVTSDNVRTVL